MHLFAFCVGVELRLWIAALALFLVTWPDRNETNGVFSTLLRSVVTAESSATWLYWRSTNEVYCRERQKVRGTDH